MWFWPCVETILSVLSPAPESRYYFSMALDDRDYMKDNSDDVINLNEIIPAGLKLIAVLVLLVLCMRIPPLFVKIPLMLAIMYLGWRWITRPSRLKRNAAKRRRRVARKTISSGPTETPATEENRNPVKMLIALDAAGEFGKAKTYIQQLDGQEFSPDEGKELAVLAKNYFPVRLEETEKGVRFYLD